MIPARPIRILRLTRKPRASGDDPEPKLTKAGKLS